MYTCPECREELSVIRKYQDKIYICPNCGAEYDQEALSDMYYDEDEINEKEEY